MSWTLTRSLQSISGQVLSDIISNSLHHKMKRRDTGIQELMLITLFMNDKQVCSKQREGTEIELQREICQIYKILSDLSDLSDLQVLDLSISAL